MDVERIILFKKKHSLKTLISKTVRRFGSSCVKSDQNEVAVRTGFIWLRIWSGTWLLWPWSWEFLD